MVSIILTCGREMVGKEKFPSIGRHLNLEPFWVESGFH